MYVDTGDFSLKLWQDALDYLKANEIEGFFTTLILLKKEVCEDLAYPNTNIYIDLNSLDDYYADIHRYKFVTSRNLRDYLTEPEYTTYISYSHCILNKVHATYQEIQHTGITEERCAYLIKTFALAQAIAFFLPPNKEPTFNTEPPSKTIHDIIDNHVEKIIDTSTYVPPIVLTTEEIKILLKKLSTLTDRLSYKYNHCCSKFLNYDIPKKCEILAKLQYDIHKQSFHAQGLTGEQAHYLLINAEKTLQINDRNPRHDFTISLLLLLSTLLLAFHKKPIKIAVNLSNCIEYLNRLRTRRAYPNVTNILTELKPGAFMTL